MISLSKATQDPRLALLSAKATGFSSIEKVVEAIDKLVKNLQDEEGTDLTNKESCETQLAQGAQEARMQSLDIDTLSEDVVRAESKVTEVKEEIEESEKEATEREAQKESLG